MQLTPEIKRAARRSFTGSPALFEACWRQLLQWTRQGAIDDPQDPDAALDWLEQIAAEKVNNPNSRFHIYG